MVEFAAVFERRRLKAAEERLGERIAELDPASDRAVQLNERLDSVIALQALGNPMRLGRSADLPLEPVSDRSVSKSALWGGGLAGLLAVLVVLGREVRRRPVRRAPRASRRREAPRRWSVVVSSSVLPRPGSTPHMMRARSPAVLTIV